MRRPNPRLALLAALSLPLGGCSWMFMTKAPDPVMAPNYPVDCTASNAAPILDTICSAYFVANGIYLIAIPDCSSAGWGEACVDSTTKYLGAALSAGLAVTCGLAAGHGYPTATRCKQVKELNALCITGDMGACQKLRPGWTPPAGLPGAPPAPGFQPPPPAPAPAPGAVPPAPGAPPAKPGSAGPSIDPGSYRSAVAAAAR